MKSIQQGECIASDDDIRSRKEGTRYQEDSPFPGWTAAPFAERGKLRRDKLQGRGGNIRNNRKIHVTFTRIQGCSKVLSLHEVINPPYNLMSQVLSLFPLYRWRK